MNPNYLHKKFRQLKLKIHRTVLFLRLTRTKNRLTQRAYAHRKDEEMISADTRISWLTQQSYDRLKQELDSLLGKHGGQTAALSTGDREARIRQLSALLKNARIHSPADDGVVEPGMLIEAEIAGEVQRFLMGSREISDHGELDVFSERSPLGAAIYGKKPGESTTYIAPSGRVVDVVIVSAKPFRIDSLVA